MFTRSGGKDLQIRKFKCVAKTRFLYKIVTKEFLKFYLKIIKNK